MRYLKGRWYYDGDTDGARYGGKLARFDGHAVEVIEIRPVREHVGDAEARDVGFPFWTVESYHDTADLGDPDGVDNKSARGYCGIETRDLPESRIGRMIVLAFARHAYGIGRGESGGGWPGEFSLPRQRHVTMRDLRVEARDFRAMLSLDETRHCR
jgi:hypothetical protein